MTRTTKCVEAAIRQAVITLNKLPEERVQGHFNAWPAIKHDITDLRDQEPVPMKFPPMPEDIDEMMQVICVWLLWLDPVERKIVWMRADRQRWKIICRHFAIGRTKGWEIYKTGLEKIARRLNERK